MSCAVDVMYQHHPYASYFPAAAYGSHRAAAAAAAAGSPPGVPPSPTSTMEQLKKFGLSKLGDSTMDPTASSTFSLGRAPSLSMRGSVASTSGSSLDMSDGITPKEEPQDPDSSNADLPQPTNTQYISSTCVLLTYFSGDTAESVDEHFYRALSQANSYSSSSSGDRKHSQTSSSWSKDSPPMSSRNFPASFWNSHYQPPPQLAPSHHPGLQAAGGPGDLASAFTADPYMASSLHTLHGTATGHHHPLGDPWGRHAYTGLTSCNPSLNAVSQACSQYSPHLQDFTSYTAVASSRFNAYTSLLHSQSTSRQCDPLKGATDTWPAPGRYPSAAVGQDPLVSASHTLGAAPSLGGGHHDSLHSTASIAGPWY